VDGLAVEDNEAIDHLRVDQMDEEVLREDPWAVEEDQICVVKLAPLLLPGVLLDVFRKKLDPRIRSVPDDLVFVVIRKPKDDDPSAAKGSVDHQLTDNFEAVKTAAQNIETVRVALKRIPDLAVVLEYSAVAVPG
jgi:hypothetical protein